MLINNAMQAERSKHLQAEQYERTADRKGHSNGFKPKTVKTRMGEITLAVSQVREGGFYPSALEKGLRSERALTITLAEMSPALCRRHMCARSVHPKGESHHRTALWG